MNAYKVLKEKHQNEFNEFPMMFAFSNAQFAEGMKKLGLKPNDTDKIYSFGGGGYYRKTDSAALKEILLKHAKEMQEAMENDLIGEGFIFDMFNYELANHEYVITYEIEDTLDALGLTFEQVKVSPSLERGLKLAMEAQVE